MSLPHMQIALSLLTKRNYLCDSRKEAEDIEVREGGVADSREGSSGHRSLRKTVLKEFLCYIVSPASQEYPILAVPPATML